MTNPKQRDGARGVKAKSTNVDCRGRVLTVFDGADRVGSLVETGGEFRAFDLDGRCLGSFPTMLRAARALPRVEPAA
jgi:hypothetical protein